MTSQPKSPEVLLEWTYSGIPCTGRFVPAASVLVLQFMLKTAVIMATYRIIDYNSTLNQARTMKASTLDKARKGAWGGWVAITLDKARKGRVDARTMKARMGAGRTDGENDQGEEGGGTDGWREWGRAAVVPGESDEGKARGRGGWMARMGTGCGRPWRERRRRGKGLGAGRVVAPVDFVIFFSLCACALTVMAVCIVEADEKKEPSVQYGNMYRLDPAAYANAGASASD